MGRASVIKEQVETVLENVPAARNSDKILIVRVLRQFYGVQAIEDLLKPSIPSTESIRRWRQFIQAEGRYLADETVRHQREKLEAKFRKEFSEH
jgi:hypothetical protein